MKKVIVTTYSTPGYAPNELLQYLREKRSEDIDAASIIVPAKHERKFVPGLSHIENYKTTISSTKYLYERKGRFDIAIGSDPIFALALSSLRSKGFVTKVVYYRLDYYPVFHNNKFLNPIYQKLEQLALRAVDEIWSISDPNLLHIGQTLNGQLHKVKYVPYLLHQSEVENYVDPSTRSNIVLWVGPDLDESRPLCVEATKKLDIPFVIADYSIDKYRLTQNELIAALRKVKVGLAPYKPEPQSPKYFCDASRIRRFLAYGVPVITTPVAPTYKTIDTEDCGYISDWSTTSIMKGINYCINNFERLSGNAYKAARKYTFESWFSRYPDLL